MRANGTGVDNGTILLVHGLWLTARSWKGWIDRYQRSGYTVLAPNWPVLVA
jgi:pimeloyl-ACP methyl ester carboxylesterase